METNKGKDKEKYSKINISDDEDDFESKSFISRTLEIPRIILEKPLKYNELRYTIDDSSDSLGKKIKRATAMKIPAVLVVGPKDAEEKVVSVRLRDKEEKVKLSALAKFLCKLS